MNVEEILKKTAHMEEQLSTFSGGNAAETVNLEELLPKYTLMRQISHCRSEVRSRKIALTMDKIVKLQETLSKLNGVLDSSSNVAKSLQYLVDSSRLIVHLINHSTKNGCIPLSREYHEQFIQIIENCTLVVSDKVTWKALSINWPQIAEVLKSTANSFQDIADVLDYTVGEHHLLHHNTLRMLEQMSTLNIR